MNKYTVTVLLLTGIVLFSCAGGTHSKTGASNDSGLRSAEPYISILNKSERITHGDGSITVAVVNLTGGVKIPVVMLPMSISFSRLVESESDNSEYDAVIASVSDAIEKKPRDIAPYIQRAGILVNRGRTDDLNRAISDCDTALKIDDSAEAAFYIRGIASAMRGDYEQAVSDMEALTITREHQTIDIRYLLGQAYYFDGKMPQAIEMMENVLMTDSDYADAAGILEMLRNL